MQSMDFGKARRWRGYGRIEFLKLGEVGEFVRSMFYLIYGLDVVMNVSISSLLSDYIRETPKVGPSFHETLTALCKISSQSN